MDVSVEEAIAYAAANRVLLELTYNGVTRMVEVYSYRVSKAGNKILMAHCHKDDKTESFRLDRIDYAKATTIPFEPRWAIEIS